MLFRDFVHPRAEDSMSAQCEENGWSLRNDRNPETTPLWGTGGRLVAYVDGVCAKKEPATHAAGNAHFQHFQTEGELCFQ